LQKREVAWYLYDWGNSAFATVMMAAVLPVFFASYIYPDAGANATSLWGKTNTIAMLVIALFAPFLGAVADLRGKKKLFILLFAAVGVVASFLLGYTSQGQVMLVLVLYAIGRVGFAGANIFYDSLLPHIVKPEKQDMVSSLGYAFGYVGGGLALLISLVWILQPDLLGFADTADATLFTFRFVAIWWLVFTLPLLFKVAEPPRLLGPQNDLVLFKNAWQQTLNTAKSLFRNREVFKFLIAYWLYNDGLSTIMVMAAIFGKEIGIPSDDLIIAILLVQFIGFPATFFFGWLAGKITTKHAIIVTLVVYAFISIGGFWVTTTSHFYMLAIAVGLVQGGAQALSRSFFAGMIPKEKSAEYFSFFDVFSKSSSILGPLLFALIIDYTGSSRNGIFALVFFFIVGIIMLANMRTERSIHPSK
jgi:UMF1 family MFS transporter